MSSLVDVVCTTMIVMAIAPFTGFTVSVTFMCMVFPSAIYALAHDIARIVRGK